jgi:hypothetical protein
MRVAASRLIDAAAELGADDRALLSLLVNHGLDDESLARALRMDAAQLCSRRAQLVEHLASALELPADYVAEQLSELSWSAQSAMQVAPTSAPPQPPEAPVMPAPPVTPAASAESTSPRRPRRRVLALSTLLVVVVVLVVVLLASGGGGTSSSARRRPSDAGAAGGGGGVQVRDHATLAALPGLAAGASGSIGVIGSAASPKLVISLSGLPSAGTGHYEVWLFNSVIDSRPLAILGPTGGTATVPLPAGYRRYRWIDVSRQAAGSTVHSGLSVLRAAVPSGA